MVKETLLQIFATMPYLAGLTYIVVYFVRHVSGGIWPPWDRILRIFFTFGIIIGLFFSLYEYAATGQETNNGAERPTSNIERPDKRTGETSTSN